MALGAIVGGVLQAGAAKKAARAQENAANRDIAFQTETRDLIRNDLAPFRDGGSLAQQAYLYEMGLGPAPMIGGTAPSIETISTPGAYTPAQQAGMMRERGQMNALGGFGGGSYGPPSTSYRVNGQTFSTMDEAQKYANANRTGGTAYGGFTKAPGYDFRLREGLNALDASAAARGGLYSGAAMQDAMTYGQDYATSEYDKFLSRIGGLVDTGMSAAQMSGNASQNAAAGVSNAFGNIGNAQAAGRIGAANAWSNGINDALGVMNYQRQNPNAMTFGDMFLGKSGWF